jgi:nucleotide-binding universal stress UspA family protein
MLVALDESPRAPAVLRAAMELARKIGAKITLLRVCLVPVQLPAQVYAVSPELIPSLLEEQTERGLSELAGEVPPELLAGIEVRVGTPWQQICEVARELDAHLIVVGSHGYSFVDRLLGTTAARVVNHADRSVLVVRGDAPATAAAR